MPVGIKITYLMGTCLSKEVKKGVVVGSQSHRWRSGGGLPQSTTLSQRSGSRIPLFATNGIRIMLRQFALSANGDFWYCHHANVKISEYGPCKATITYSNAAHYCTHVCMFVSNMNKQLLQPRSFQR